MISFLNPLLEMNKYLGTIILSFLPISELRGGIPFGLASGISLPLVFILAVISNILVVPIGFWFLDKLNPIFLKMKWYDRFYNKNLEKARKRISKQMEKYEYLGLTIFVAIPLPITGAYTGTLGAWALGLDRKKSFLHIVLGVIIAGLVVSIIAYYGLQAFYLFIK